MWILSGARSASQAITVSSHTLAGHARGSTGPGGGFRTEKSHLSPYRFEAIGREECDGRLKRG